jgi:hypothetical protein
MRIGQLARRLGVPPSDILGFLATQNIETETGTNSRIGDDLVARVVGHFAPEKLSEILAAPPVEEPIEQTPIVEVTETEVTEVIEETPTHAVEETVGEADATPEEPVEVIRVSKVELQGLKVLGKIDLPEPKKKAEPAADQQPKKEFEKRNDRRNQREWKNPLEVKRQQEARAKEKKKQEEADRLKEQRTNNYYKKVKSVPTKSARRIEEQTVVEDIEVKEAPKGLIGKFLRWLRT